MPTSTFPSSHSFKTMSSSLSSLPPSSPTPQNHPGHTFNQPLELLKSPIRRRLRSSSCPPATPRNQYATISRSSSPLSNIESADGSELDRLATLSDLHDISPATQKRINIENGQRRRAATLAEQRRLREIEATKIAEQGQKRRCQYLQEAVARLNRDGYTFGDMIMHFLDPESSEGRIWWHQFLIVPGRLEQILAWFDSGEYPLSIRQILREWAVQKVCNMLGQQASNVTNSNLLKTHNRIIDEEFIVSFNLKDYYGILKKGGGDLIIRVFEAVARSPKHPTFTPEWNLRADVVVTSSVLACLGERNHSNNISKVMMGLYLHALGAQRQNITVLSRLGICESYNSMVRNEVVKDAAAKKGRVVAVRLQRRASHKILEGKRLGSLPLLSASMREHARNLAQTGLMEEVFDNINFLLCIGEQKVGSHNTQVNGTCETLLGLWKALPNHLKTADLIDAFLKASALQVSDLLHNNDEKLLFDHCLVHDIVQIIIEFSGQDQLRVYQTTAKQKQPVSLHRIEVHKTKVYPLPALNIDKSTIKGVGEVDEAVVKELKLESIEGFWERARLVAGDQLSLARLRALQNIRAGQEDGYECYSWLITVPGVFHIRMADMHGVVFIHFGEMNNPSCLCRDNATINRLPITLTSLPSFRTCQDLVSVSLYARILHCLLIVSKQPSLEAYSKSVKSFRQLQDDAAKVYEQFANTNVVAELRSERELKGKGHGDVVFENACLFLRDALYSYELQRAVKAGDSGRVVLVLKIWALSFRGNGRTKYAYEMLHLIHNLTRVWPKVKIVLNNWLVNTTGKENRFLEVDLLQEHLNYWIKVFYKAHGSNMSWEWIAMIAPCVNILRHLATAMNESLGHRQGSRHTSVNIENDINALMKSYEEHGVYKVQEGRTVDDDTQIFTDCVTAGLEALTAGNDNPLTEYNSGFHNLQKRRRMPPLSIKTAAASHSSTSIPAAAKPSQGSSASGSTSAPAQLPSQTPNISPEDSSLHSPLTASPTFAGTEANLRPSDDVVERAPGDPNSDGIRFECEMDGLGLDSEEDETVAEVPVDALEGDPTFDITTESDVELFSGEEDGSGDDFGETDYEDDEDVVVYVSRKHGISV
ncbi:hypothetical protein PM082_018517 [Marasmius tenuissimus]|nr:hypothetical protein PM082_018517 [Marasmius tenuissimus]